MKYVTPNSTSYFVINVRKALLWAIKATNEGSIPKLR